jgi:hypothetical protein
MCELRWLKVETVVEARQFSTYKESQPDLDQLSTLYRQKFRATHAEIWDDEALR